MTRASTTLFWLSLTIIVSLGLYHTSYRTEEMGRQLRSLNAQIEAEQRNIHVLKAEWVFLTNPARIEGAARKHLALAPASTKQIAKLEKLADVLPTQKEAMGGTTVQGTPMASLRSQQPSHSPRQSASETGHINTRLVMPAIKAAEALPPREAAYRLAGDESYGIANNGAEP